MLPADGLIPWLVSPDERLDLQELAALVPCVARSLQGAAVLWRMSQGAGQVITSELLVVTPQVLAFARQVARLEAGTLLVAPAPLALCATPVIDLDGVFHGALCVLFSSGTVDTRALAVQEAARLLAFTLQRQQVHARFQSMLDGLHEGVVLLDHRLQVQASNRRAGQLLGQAGQGMSQQDFTAFGLQARGLDGQPIPRDGLPMWAARETGQPQLNIILGAPLPSGEERWLRVNARPVWPGGVVASLADVTEGVRLRQAMQQALEHDPLTGLPNRALFETRVQEALNALRMGGSGFAVGFVDLDGFKAVNDTLGHDAGDSLLRQVTQRLTQAVRPRDVVARLAGDEFTVLWWGVPEAAQAAGLGQRLVQACAPAFQLREAEVTVTCSVGVRVVTRANLTVRAVVGAADGLMYQAKRQGKNQCFVGQGE
jgi:diguanylate cyclase (GGDEF)-like protein